MANVFNHTRCAIVLVVKGGASAHIANIVGKDTFGDEGQMVAFHPDSWLTTFDDTYII